MNEHSLQLAFRIGRQDAPISSPRIENPSPTFAYEGFPIVLFVE